MADLLNTLIKAHPLSDGSGQSSLPPAGKPANSLFGNLNTSQPPSTASTSQSQQTSTLFGSLSQPQQIGGQFGSSSQMGSTQQQPQTTNFFGGTQGNQGTSSGLFAPQQTSQSTGGLFGSNNTQQSQPQQAGGLFSTLGQPQTQAQQTQTGLFGSFNNQNKTSSLLCVYLLPFRCSSVAYHFR